jgi:hypothetical protein
VYLIVVLYGGFISRTPTRLDGREHHEACT